MGFTSKRFQAEAEVVLSHSAEQLWEYISNTNETNLRVGLAPTQFSFVPSPSGGSQMSVKTRLAGFLSVEYEELPFEWIRPFYFVVDRLFSRGPLRTLRFEVELEEVHVQKTIVRAKLAVGAKFPFPFLGWVTYRTLDRFLDFFQNLDEKIDLPSVSNRPGFELLRKREPDFAKIDELTQRWSGELIQIDLARALAEYVVEAPDFLVARLRPKEVASRLGISSELMIEAMLELTKAGEFSLVWSVLCPSCKGAKLESDRLADVSGEAHCESCNIRYDATFDENVEVTFRPDKGVREVEIEDFCFGSPYKRPDLQLQMNLKPGECKQIALSLPLGTYQWRNYGRILSGPFKVQELVTESQLGKIRLDQEPVEFGLEVSDRITIEIENPSTEHRGVIQLEKLGQFDQTLTGHEVTTLQNFRDSFGSAIFRPGEEVRVSNTILMFTDLKDSTAMYEEIGDALAFSLVQDHFDILFQGISDHGGSIVKTIGDAVMAVFVDLERAVEASRWIIEEVRRWNGSHDHSPVEIKLGLHQGPAILVTQNGKLDYFGSTVNRAARVQGTARAGEIVLSEDVFMSLETQRALDRLEGVTVEKFRTPVKGVSEVMLLYRVFFAERHGAVPEPSGGLSQDGPGRKKLASNPHRNLVSRKKSAS